MTIEIINPATGDTYQCFEEISQSEANNIIKKTQNAYETWQSESFADRAAILKQASSLLLERRDEYASIITQEMGKPISQAKKEIEKCALVCDHYADHAASYLEGRTIKTELSKSYVSYHPIGIVFAIMPWNFPFWQVLRFAAPTLMAGNAALLKHAPNSTATGLAIEKLFEDAGAPKHLFRTLVINNDVAAEVIKNPAVCAVTLTGSERAGSAVGATAAGAIKKVVLELGGCDGYIVLEDADLDLAAKSCIQSRLNNTGQVCISAKRIIVMESIKEEMINRIREQMKAYVKSDPMDPDCMLGPIARDDLRAGIDQQVKKSIACGAQCLIGGKMDDGPGFYYPATLLTEVGPGMPAYEEEIFGPVISIISVNDEEEAIRVANQTPYGLSAGVFTTDLEKGEKIARDQLIAGVCCVNSCASSDPRLPFGGTKLSGYGRELSQEGIREFCNIKTVCIK